MEGGETYGDIPGEQEEPLDPPGQQGPGCGYDLLEKKGLSQPTLSLDGIRTRKPPRRGPL